MANISIKPGAVLDDAVQIDTIMNDIDTDMKTLDSVIKNVIPDGIKTDWSDLVRTNWEKYYNDSVPVAMESIKVSANNLRLAVDEAVRYSKGQ